MVTKKTISNAELKSCEDAWQEGWTFADFVKFYNDADVIGFTEALEKYLALNQTMKLDVFKMSMSLPGLTKRYLFQNLPKEDYFAGFGEEHKWLVEELRKSIVGGPSIIFHRWHERMKTLIRGIENNFCRCIRGYDANALYLFCFGQLMPTGWYELLEKKNSYQSSVKYSQQAIQWLEYMASSQNVHIIHAENGGEKRINNFKVDGFDEVNNTVYSFHGCFWHGHPCHVNADLEKWEKTKRREQDLRDLGYTVVTMTSCEWMKMPESKTWYHLKNQEQEQEQDQDDLSEEEKLKIKQDQLIEDIKNDKVFGFVKCSLHVPDHLIDEFSDFPPIYKNCEIDLKDVGETMQAYCESIGRKPASNVH